MIFSSPNNDELVLALLYEELKSYTFFTSLRNLGLDDSCWQSELGSIILTHLGMHDSNSETLNQYYQLLDHYSQSFHPGQGRHTPEVVYLYTALLNEKAKRSIGH